MLRQYQSFTLDRFYKINNVFNQVVLEVGGLKSMAIPHDLVKHGAKEVVSISLNDDVETTIVTDKIFSRHQDAVNTNFPSNYFDSVISVATLEHISDLAGVLRELYRVVKPGGIVYMHGGPIWSSRCGSHYDFCSGNIAYHFIRNPVLHDWEHLYSDVDGIFTRLKDLYPTSMIDKLLHEVYESNFINRLHQADIIKIINDSGFLTVSNELDKWGSSIPSDLYSQIKNRNPLFEEGCDSISVCCMKP